jgi:anti-sigma B factor antagonist
MGDFQINTQKLSEGVTSISIKGFLDAYTYSEFEQTINNLFNQKQYKLVVDMSNVDYISSAGAGVFIGAIGLAQENNGNIIIIRPKPGVKEVFDLLGLSQIFTITNNLESAIKTLTGK